MKVVLYCGTNKYLWAVRPFLHLFDKYWGKDATVHLITTRLPSFPLPRELEYSLLPAHFFKNGDVEMHHFTSAHRWFLESMGDEVFGYFLPDHWIIRPVDVEKVNRLYSYTVAHPDIARMNLGYGIGVSRLAKHLEYYEDLEIAECLPGTNELKISLTPCFFRANLLLDLMQPNLDPWTAENDATRMLRELYPTYRSVAAWPELVHHVDVCSHVDQNPKYVRFNHIYPEDMEAILPMIPEGWTPVGMGK
jgi:hypothetical protein